MNSRPRPHRLSTAVIVVALAAPALAAEPPNLVANGDFAKVTGGLPDQWQASGDASVTQVLRAAADADQKPFAQLVCTRCEGGSGASHAMLAQVGAVRLAKGRTYEFSCRARAEGLRSRSVSVGVSDTADWTNCGLLADLALGGAWRTYRRVFQATRDVGPTSRLQFWFTEPGTLSVADVRIVEHRPEDATFTDVVPPAGGKNLVANGSFEVGAGGWSSLGTRVGWGGLSRLHGRIERGEATHGRAFLRIPLGGAQTPVLHFDYYEPVVRRELRPLAASLGWMAVEKDAFYTLSCDLRAGRDGVRAVLGARAKDPDGRSADLRQRADLGTAWKRYTMTIQPGHGFLFVFAGPDLAEEQDVYVDIDAVQLEKGRQATAFEPRRPVEFALEPSETAGLFTAGRPAAVVLRAANHGAAPARLEVRFEAADFFDRPLAWPAETLEVPAASAVERRRDLAPEWRGYGRIRAAAQAGAGPAETADLRLAVVPPRGAADSVCGINHAFTTPDLIRLASKAGVTWYRDWSLKWQHMEPARGEFRWERGDAQIDRVLREGPHVLPLLPPFPSADWSSEAPEGLPTTGYPGARLRQAWGPKDPKDLAAFIEKAVARYKDRIHVWEFLNEPIYTDYALPADRGNRYGGKRYGPADYVALLETAAAAMRRADGACKIIGGIAGGARHLTREVIEAGALRHLDVMNLHYYPGSRLPEGFAAEMDDLGALMDARGGRRPVWITEFSYYAADDLPRKPFVARTGAWAEERLLESERQGADFTVRFFLVMLAHGAEKIFIHSGASGQANEADFECALFGYGGAPRKLFPALAVLTELLGPAPKCAGERRLGDTAHAVAFETGQGALVAAWTEDDGDAGAVSAPAGGDGWLDIVGRKEAARRVPLSTSPMYVQGPAGKAKEMLAAVEFHAPR